MYVGGKIVCGVFGAVGRNYSIDKVKMLAMLNESRGGHATGFYNGRVVYKKAVGAEDFLKEDACKEYLNKKHKFILGHTRFGTHGSNSDSKNAHPFIFDNIVGMHNGVINNIYELEKLTGKKLTVDSEYIFELLSGTSNITEVEKSLSNLQGYWGLVWYDLNKSSKVFFSCHDNTIYYCIQDGVMYYSSDKNHLELVTNLGIEINLIEHDTVISVDTNNLKIKEYKLSNMRTAVKYDWRKGSRNTSYYNYEDEFDYGYSAPSYNKNKCGFCQGYSSQLVYDKTYQTYLCPDCREYYNKEDTESKDNLTECICQECGREILKGDKFHKVFGLDVCEECYNVFYNDTDVQIDIDEKEIEKEISL